MKRIYVTHCSAEKDPLLQGTGQQVTPDRLYTATSIQAFMARCQEKQVDWAILSDLYGVWLSQIEHMWYEKHPDTVTEPEFHAIVEDFNQTLQPYDQIYFYVCPQRFHPFYQRVLQTTALKDRVHQFTSLEAIC